MRSISRTVGVSINTVTKLLVDAGEAAADYHDRTVRNVTVKRVQCDEIWAFCYAKERTLERAKKAPEGAGDVWTWTALDSDSKMILAYEVGDRSGATAREFMQNLKDRIANRVQLTTDGYSAYFDAVEEAFGGDVDYAQLVKLYGETEESEKRYSPAKCTGIRQRVVYGDPDPDHISTSYVERHNLSMRMGMRRFTRLTNAFSKKLANHLHMLSLYFVHYNFIRIHKTLRVTPVMEAGLTDTLHDIDWLVDLIETAAPKPRRPNNLQDPNFKLRHYPAPSFRTATLPAAASSTPRLAAAAPSPSRRPRSRPTSPRTSDRASLSRRVPLRPSRRLRVSFAWVQRYFAIVRSATSDPASAVAGHLLPPPCSTAGATASGRPRLGTGTCARRAPGSH